MQATSPEELPGGGVHPAAGADGALAAATATTRRFREAAEARDIDALLDTLAEDVVLHSPITDRVSFRGRAELGELMRSVFATLEDIRYFADVGDARTRALFDRARVGGQALEQAVRIQLNDRQQIEEITIFFRPLPGLARLTAELAPRMARTHGRGRYIMARILLAPLARVTRAGDRLAPWLA
jgi:hypothetical protein